MAKAASYTDGRMWTAGGKSSLVPFFSIRLHYKYEDNVASTSVTPVSARADWANLPDLTTIWKLQATLRKTKLP